MLIRRKLLTSLLMCLLLSTLASPYCASQSTKSGWDYLKSSSAKQKTGFQQNLKQNSQSITKKVYKQGDLQNGVLRIAPEFHEFSNDETISLSLRNADIKEVLKELARLGNKSIIVDNSVGGQISCELEEVSLNQAMDLALATTELESRVLGNTIFIASKPAMLRKGLNRNLIKSFKLNYANCLDVASVLEASIFNKGLDVTTSISEQTSVAETEAITANQAIAMQAIDTGGTTILTGEPSSGNIVSVDTSSAPASSATSASATGGVSSGTTRPVRVIAEKIDAASGYNDAATLAGEVKINGTTATSSTYNVNNNSGGPIVIPDSRTNSILIAGLRQDIQVAEETIKYLDQAKKQVNIEVSLIEMTRTDLSTLGMSVGSNAKAFTGAFNNPTGTLTGNGGSFTPNGNIGSTGVPTWVTNHVSQDAMTRTVGMITEASQTAIQISSIKNITSDIVAKIEALITKDKVKLIANPNVIVSDGSEALVKLTNQIINRITVTQTQTTTTSSQELADVGIVLNVLPRISDDGYVTMRVRPSVTSPGDRREFDFGTAQFEITLINTREVLVQDVRVKSGETVALAGLIREFSRAQTGKVPFMGDLPLIGNFFRTKSNQKEKTELVILITPKIIEDNGMNQLISTGQVPIN